MNDRTIDVFFELVRLGIGHEKSPILGNVDWVAVKVLSDAQGLTAIVLDGLEKYQTKNLEIERCLPQPMKLQWIGEVYQDYEQRYVAYKKAISTLTGLYNQYDYKMMVLKGYMCSIDWPRPEHRPAGDIDIWLFGKQKEADKLIEEVGVEVDQSHHHHTVFNWKGFMVENHYDFINVHHHKSNAEFEKILKNLGQDDRSSVELNGEKVYLPSPDLHALFLLKHLMMHFAAEGITLRQIVDWGFFVNAHGKDVDWKMVLDVLERFGMKDLFNIINAICVEELGFDAKIFPQVQFNPVLKDRVLNEILVTKYSASVPKNIFSRIAFKVRRWRDNEWKHQLCYKDSMWSAFWSGVWNHLLKPSSI